jgi:hypothetical protein
MIFLICPRMEILVREDGALVGVTDGAVESFGESGGTAHGAKLLR